MSTPDAYDYVIVGGGSAGCVVASRLAAAEPDATVLLIEAGPDGRGVTQIVDPPSWTRLPGTSLDWGHAYEPSAAVAGRAIPVARGKVLGGCGAISAMLWNRGHPADYDAWEAAGAAGWNYAALLPYFRRSEDLAATAAYADLIDRPLMPAGRLGRAEAEAFVRENCATLSHACGTAAMGTGPAAVVDPELNVIGIDGLRIADASVIPVIPTGHTQAPVIAIAERAVDLITRRPPSAPAWL